MAELTRRARAVNKAAKYILWRFTQLNRARLSIYPHLTQATDTSNVRSSRPLRRSILLLHLLTKLPPLYRSGWYLLLSRRRSCRMLCETRAFFDEPSDHCFTFAASQRLRP